MFSALTHLATPLTYVVALLIVGALLFLVASFAFGRGERLAPMPPDTSPVVLPANRPATGRDLRRLRISVVLRGYRMSEVDWILDRLAEQLDERDRELARLRAEAEPGPDRDGAAPPADDATESAPADPTSAPAGGGATDPQPPAGRVEAPARAAEERRRG